MKNIDIDTAANIGNLAMILRNGGLVAYAVARTGSEPAVREMMTAQRLLREAIARHDIPAIADLSVPEPR